MTGMMKVKENCFDECYEMTYFYLQLQMIVD